MRRKLILIISGASAIALLAAYGMLRTTSEPLAPQRAVAGAPSDGDIETAAKLKRLALAMEEREKTGKPFPAELLRVPDLRIPRNSPEEIERMKAAFDLTEVQVQKLQAILPTIEKAQAHVARYEQPLQTAKRISLVAHTHSALATVLTKEQEVKLDAYLTRGSAP